jgi:hypothetical protein
MVAVSWSVPIACVAGLLGASLSTASQADASVLSLITAWDAPEQCPSASDVMARLEALRGASPSEWGPEREVRGRISRGAGGAWLLELEIRQRPALPSRVRRRTLEAPRCDELGEAAALAISIALDSSSVADAEVAEGTGAYAPASLPMPPFAEQDAPPPRDATRRMDGPARHDREVVLGAAAALDTASVAGPAIGLSIEGKVQIGAVGIGAYGLWLPAQREVVRRGTSGQYVDFSLLGGGVRGCYRVLDRAVRIDGCAGFEAGAVDAAPHGLTNTREARDTWLAPHAGAALSWSLPASLAIESRFDGVFPLGRDSYVVDTEVTVHETPRAVARFFLGLQGSWGLF